MIAYKLHRMAKEKNQFKTKITDEEDLEEIRKIEEILNPNEEIFVVARQSRLRPGGSRLTPNTVYATDRRIIIRDPSMLGLKAEVIDIPYNLIANARLEKGVFSSSVIFTAPGLFNANIGTRIPGVKRLGENEHGENGEIDAIPKDKADELIKIIRTGISQLRSGNNASGNKNMNNNSQLRSVNSTGNNAPDNENMNTTLQVEKISVAEELEKLAKLRQEGVISEEEFNKMKAKLVNKE